MKKTSLSFLLGCVGLFATQCSPSLTDLVVPVQVLQGQPFTVQVKGTSPPASYHGSAPVGCVVQLPVGVSVVAAANSWNSAMTVDSLVTACTPEIGHYLTSFVGLASLPVDGALTLTLLAGPGAPATGTIKVSLGLDVGSYVPTSPAGITDFAQIGGAHARPFVAAPPVFGADSGVPVANGSAAAVGDLDGDGNDDVLDWAAGGQSLVAVLSRPGSASVTVATAVGAAGGGAVALGHFDRDGRPDAVFAGQVWFGDGSGGFGAASGLPGAPPMDFVGVGDVDADGVADLVCGGPNDLRVLRSNGERTFADWSAGLPTLPSGYYFPASPWHLADLTGDGHADLVGFAAQQVGGAQRALLVVAGDGQGGWTAGTPFAIGEATDLQVGDLNGDGVVDVVVAGGAYAAPLFQVWNVAPNLTWVAGFTAPQLGPQAGLVRLLDHDRDGWLDVLAVQAATPALVRLLRGTGGGAFVEWANHGLPTALAVPGTLLVGDWNGDTFPDVTSDGPVGWLGLATGARPYGRGCSALGVAPTLAGAGAPQQGNAAFGLELQGPPLGGSVLWVGFSKRAGLVLPPLPFDLAAYGAPGCVVFAEPRVLSFVVGDPSGIARLPLGIPVDPTLHRLALFAQGASLVPGANALGAVLSPGLVVRID